MCGLSITINIFPYLISYKTNSFLLCFFCISFKNLDLLYMNIMIFRMHVSDPDKIVYLKIIFVISQPKHMLWVLIRTFLLSAQNACLFVCLFV